MRFIEDEGNRVRTVFSIKKGHGLQVRASLVLDTAEIENKLKPGHILRFDISTGKPKLLSLMNEIKNNNFKNMLNVTEKDWLDFKILVGEPKNSGTSLAPFYELNLD